MQLIDEGYIKKKVQQSNYDAVVKKHGKTLPSYPLGMAKLICNYHGFSLPNSKGEDDLSALWIPRRNTVIFDDELLHLYLGAFARKQQNKSLIELNKRAASIKVLFTNDVLQKSVNHLLGLSMSLKPSLLNMEENTDLNKECENFWDECMRHGMTSPIYIKNLIVCFS